ncbi:MAG: NYN domain-containing protein, partial [Firmicutes bacterium]|nr:NYN domain-containing protein [Bacillota bacterium]
DIHKFLISSDPEELKELERQLLEKLGDEVDIYLLGFDGYKIKGNLGDKSEVDDILVVYTKEGETGDMYIEKLLREMGKHDHVRVATSDALIQVAALGSGVLRMSARELEEEIGIVRKKLNAMLDELNRKNQSLKNRMTERKDEKK